MLVYRDHPDYHEIKRSKDRRARYYVYDGYVWKHHPNDGEPYFELVGTTSPELSDESEEWGGEAYGPYWSV